MKALSLKTEIKTLYHKKSIGKSFILKEKASTDFLITMMVFGMYFSLLARIGQVIY